MNTIANAGTMSKEMMGALMNNKTGMMVIQQHAMMMMESQSSTADRDFAATCSASFSPHYGTGHSSYRRNYS